MLMRKKIRNLINDKSKLDMGVSGNLYNDTIVRFLITKAE